MDQHTRSAQQWLDRRYSRRADGRYRSHQPIDGLKTADTEPNPLPRLARTTRILDLLGSVPFESVLDVGGGEGYLAALIRDLFRPPVIHTSDISVEACRRACEFFGVHGAVADGARLPFADDSYDVVICSEVIEHLSRPVVALAELARVARKFVLVSTEQFSPLGELERRLRYFTLDRDYPHADLNWFTAKDFRDLFGPELFLCPEYRMAPTATMPATVEEARALVDSLIASDTLDVDHTGIVAVCARGAERIAGVRARRDPQTSGRILDRVLAGPSRAPSPVSASAVPDDMLQRLRCPACGGGLGTERRAGLTCSSCGQTFAVTDGVPLMCVEAHTEDSTRGDAERLRRFAERDPDRERRVLACVDRLHNSEQKQNPAWKRRAAGYVLRLLWFVRRNETPVQKIRRALAYVIRFLPAPQSQSDKPARKVLL